MERRSHCSDFFFEAALPWFLCAASTNDIRLRRSHLLNQATCAPRTRVLPVDVAKALLRNWPSRTCGMRPIHCRGTQFSRLLSCCVIMIIIFFYSFFVKVEKQLHVTFAARAEAVLKVPWMFSCLSGIICAGMMNYKLVPVTVGPLSCQT